MTFDKFVYGKDQTQRVVSVEIEGDTALLFLADGTCFRKKNDYYIIYSEMHNYNLITLQGNLHYKFAEKFTDYQQFQAKLNQNKAKEIDQFIIWNPKEAFMTKSGITYYKGMRPKDVSGLSFDIETTGLDKSANQVVLISNTFRSGDRVERRLFNIKEYNSEREMIYAWVRFVQEKNPDVLTGHNIFGFDLPFLHARAEKLEIGRDLSDIKIAKRASEFRKDGSQSYDYNNILCYGREIVDTFFLSIKYDVARNYPSYKLKEIIKYEGLERPDRQYFDASKIKQIMDNDEEWTKLCKYAEHDADDALALFDLMIPSYFYFCQHIPKTLQQVINGASGAQVNSFMVRSYLQEGHSLPKPSPPVAYEGAISFGNPGIYSNVGKFDVASLYPSIIRQYNVADKSKDPKGYFLKMVEHFTLERLKNKKLAKETNDRYYKDLEQSQKIFINSAYGFLGATGLTFNAPDKAAEVTRIGREVLNKGLEWAKLHELEIVNADTDSFSFAYHKELTDDIMNEMLEGLNSRFPELIKWENDGIYSKVIIVKAKNYVLKDAKTGKVKIKGSALKATMKEPALGRFINDIIDVLIGNRKTFVDRIYNQYVNSIGYINKDNIKDWASKKTITKSVLNPERTNEQKIKDAIDRAKISVNEGDKIFVYFKSDDSLGLVETFDGDYNKKTLYKKLYNTLEIFDTVLNVDEFPNYALKKNEKLLQLN